MKCLVTGGAGFIGSHVVDRLVQEGHTVIALDNLSLNENQNILHLMNNPKFVFYKRSITENMEDIFEKEKPEYVFHLAALPRVQFSIKNPQETHHANVNGTLNILSASKKYGVRRFIFTSSSSVYGDQPTLPYKESMHPNPISPYALHKLVGEYYCKLFTQLYGLETISLRYFNVFGPRQNPAGDYACLIPKFALKFISGVSPIINGDGNQTRDFTFVKDVAEANLLAAKTNNLSAIGEAFNIGNCNNVSVKKVAETLKRLLMSEVPILHGPAVIEPKNTLADITKAREMLGWTPKYTFEQGLKETLDSIKAHNL
ncbi:SDR family oxidoreductase [Candidatus Pacearchaeota archaeon]|nr:SDR family oxidoreductase [Candidatus Pacearchaeota archaeon]